MSYHRKPWAFVPMGLVGMIGWRSASFLGAYIYGVQTACVAQGKGLVIGAVTSDRMLQICEKQGVAADGIRSHFFRGTLSAWNPIGL